MSTSVQTRESLSEAYKKFPVCVATSKMMKQFPKLDNNVNCMVSALCLIWTAPSETECVKIANLTDKLVNSMTRRQFDSTTPLKKASKILRIDKEVLLDKVGWCFLVLTHKDESDSVCYL